MSEKQQKLPEKKKRFLKKVDLIVFILVVGVIATIAIPNYLKFKSKVLSSPAKTNLLAIYSAQRTYFEKHGVYGGTFQDINWVPPRNPMYAYFLSPTEHVGRPIFDPDLKLPVDFAYMGLPTPCVSKNGFTVIAIGNIDEDDDLDAWSINDDKIINNDLNDY